MRKDDTGHRASDSVTTRHGPVTERRNPGVSQSPSFRTARPIWQSVPATRGRGTSG
ncbi:hypothetical protein GCM10012286_69310 [Streptomyces lasiicapitis]|uniref:Uncharacterized protein n=1 Tax=Streptomyces lasiicapitis TaxID=1923961 RepID=A0ABQ2MPU7_9ACTN|nr:hypothetical protein GCM10012286_69310 [Streptomyces lasiicapitis]